MPKREGFEEQDFLGGRVSSKVPAFKVIAKLGYEEAEQYQMVQFLKWLFENPDASIEDLLEKAIELKGIARFLPLTSELTKLSMILGYKRKERGYNE